MTFSWRSLCVIFVLHLYFTLLVASEDFNTSDSLSYLPIANRNGKVVYMTKDLWSKINDEQEIWHWMPWQRTRTKVADDVIREVDCIGGSSINSYPDGILTDEQLQNGGFILYMLFGIVSFTLLAIVCNDYFIPCVELICEDLKIPQNVAAATFMSVATSCPEFFVNVISTFITESDMGIGTIIGSAIFNALGVAAVGGLSAISPIAIERKPVTRDAIIYMFNVCVLVAIVWDSQVDWYEAMVLGILYILYFVIMFNSMRLFALFDKMTAKLCKKKTSEVTEIVKSDNDKPVEDGIDNKGFTSTESVANGNGTIEKDNEVYVADNPVKEKSIWAFPREKSLAYKLGWLYILPLRVVLRLTIPSPVTCRKFYPFAFFMCIIWIGLNSYLVTWSMTVIGHVFLIPDSVMGMTFLAFGGCLPEASSIFIMSRRGEGGIGVSNALGANSLAILFALGIPWLIRTLTLLGQGAENPVVYINSAGIDFVVGSLVVAVCLLWITLFIGKFKLRKTIGAVFLALYAIFISFAILVELGIILGRGMDFC